MFEVFYGSFNSTLFAVLKIFIIILAAGIIIRRQIMTSENLSVLSKSVVLVFLPCLIFSNIIKNFNPSAFGIWYVLPLSAVILVAAGLVLAFVLFAGKFSSKKDMFAVSSMQNAGYFILPLGDVLFKDQLPLFRLYCFLFILGISPILWSVGKYLISGGSKEKFSIKQLITPPLAANILALAIVFSGASKYVPTVLMDSAELLGKAAVPVATFVLGGVLGGVSLKFKGYITDAVKVIFIKMFAVPALTIAFLWWTGVFYQYPLLESFLVLQASSAPATSIMLQVKHYGGNENKVGSVVLLNYIIAIVSVPLFSGIWTAIRN